MANFLNDNSLSEYLEAETARLDGTEKESENEFELNIDIFEALEAIEITKYTQMASYATNAQLKGTQIMEAALLTTMMKEIDKPEEIMNEADEGTESINEAEEDKAAKGPGRMARAWARIAAFFKGIWNFITFKTKAQKEKVTKAVAKLKGLKSSKTVGASHEDKLRKIDDKGGNKNDIDAVIAQTQRLEAAITKWNRAVLGKFAVFMKKIEAKSKSDSKPATSVLEAGKTLQKELNDVTGFIDTVVNGIVGNINKGTVPAADAVKKNVDELDTKINDKSTAIAKLITSASSAADSGTGTETAAADTDTKEED